MKIRSVLLLLFVWLAITACSLSPSDDLTVLFDGQPKVFDKSLFFQGEVVGQMQSRKLVNGVSCVRVQLDGTHESLRQTNMAVVVKNGQMHLVQLSGYGQPLTSGTNLNGFINSTSYRWFTFSNLMSDINLAAHRRAERLNLRHEQRS